MRTLTARYGSAMPNDPDLLDVAAVAALIGVTPSTVRKYRSDGRLPEPHAVYGASPVWQRADIEAWHASRPGPNHGLGGRPRKVAAKAKPATKRKP